MKAPASWPSELAQAFEKKVEEYWADEPDYENADNFRVCRIGNKDEELAYRKAGELGCCGEFEVEWNLGRVIVLYGFNYGH